MRRKLLTIKQNKKVVIALFCLTLSSCATGREYKPGIYHLYLYNSRDYLLQQMTMPSRPLATNELESKLNLATMVSRSERKNEIFRLRDNLCKVPEAARVIIASPSGVVINEKRCH